MAHSLRQNTIYRPLRIVRYYCQGEPNSLYEKHERGEQPRKVHGQLYPEWRKPWHKREGETISKINIFVEKNPNMKILSAMQRIPTLTFGNVKDWWKEMKEIQEIENQKFLPDRVAALGSNLAAIHFFTYRHCSVRLKDSKEWISGDTKNLNLPSTFVSGYFVEAVDCSKFHFNGIRYEGIKNLTGLNFLKWLSLRNNKFIDVWCLDRLAGQNGSSLEFLDIVGCNICVGSIFALSRMLSLKCLVLSDPGDNIELQAAISMLEEDKPSLLIKTIPNPESENNSD
ncbi:uncharacterized protein LOC123710425 [Pieris brassicae]|uniref:uncharacterized protein LOC123710425 n=1 Tax=Pieris brassicae TaxID=7116 RepID=UPI001E66196A|nr:uncharacterized protein LOC123710425 [Pieris brassicae]